MNLEALKARNEELEASLRDAWEALGYVFEWCYPGSSDAVLDACSKVARDSFGRVSATLGWEADYPFGRRSAPRPVLTCQYPKQRP